MYFFSSSNFLLPSNKKYLNCREFGCRILTQAESFVLILVIKKERKITTTDCFYDKTKMSKENLQMDYYLYNSRVFIENLRVAFKRVLDLNCN